MQKKPKGQNGFGEREKNIEGNQSTYKIDVFKVKK